MVSFSVMLLIGLGNPGKKYEDNRHNVGIIFLHWIVSKYSDTEIPIWRKDSSGSFYYSKNDNDLVFAYPNSFMNLSGIGVGRATKQFAKNPQVELYIAHDDLDIALGNFKIDFAKGPKLHNGLDSVEAHLHTKDFFRIRIGVDARDPGNRMPGEAYVLQDFVESEMQVLTGDVFPQIAQRLEIST